MRTEVNQELAVLRQKFRNFYVNKLYKNYVELEVKRQAYLKRFYRRLAWLFLYITIYICMCVFSQLKEFFWMDDGFRVLFAVGIVLGVYTWKPVIDYKKDTKETVMNKILSFWGDLRYFVHPAATLQKSALEYSQLFDNFNVQDCNDCFEGTYNGAHIVVSEQKLKYDVGCAQNHIRSSSVFKGILISFDLAKKFNGHTVVRGRQRTFTNILHRGESRGVIFLLGLFICYGIDFFKDPKMLLAALFPLFCIFLPAWIRAFIIWQRKGQLRGVNLEDVVFGKQWFVRATNQVEARYVLTPAFMERMLEVKRRFHGKKIEFSFWDNKVLIAIHTNKDMFETTSLFSSALSYYKVQEVLTQFWAVFSVVDILMRGEQNRKS